MPAPYIHTPATANNASYLDSGLDRLGEMSPEKSFFAPPQSRDLISQMKGAKRAAMNLGTPRAGGRDPLRLLPNGNQGKTEFTPLMMSVTKNNLARRMSGKKAGVPDTPAYLQEGYSINGATPGLPRMAENSQLQSENTSSSAGHANDYTPMPQNISSSAQSTPLAQLPGREGGGVVNDGNMMTLREQENIIDKIEKENFGLKMKIHFLEEALSKRGNEFNQAALKENTDLKVNRITMQRELHKFKKNIAQAERDAEIYRLQLEEYRERIRRKQADESVRIEVERMQTELKSKETEIQKLKSKIETVQHTDNEELEKLRDDIGDLQADLREKDRLIEEREDEVDALKMNASKESNVSAELEEELETAKQQLEELKEDLQRATEAAQEAKEEREEASDEKRKAEQDLDELRDEMANKSFTTKGLSRQLEEKANKLEDDFEELQERHTDLQSKFEEKVQSERGMQERVRELEKGGASETRRLQQELELAQQQRDTAERKLANMSKQLQTTENELQIRTDEKDLLQSRHDALTAESASLQRDLASAQKSLRELENALDEERHRSAQNEHLLRSQQKTEGDLLNDQIDALHREVNAKDNENAAQAEEFEAHRRTLEAASQRAEEKASGLQRTVDKLQEAQGTLSGEEMKFQEALESEKQRHQQEEKLLLKQIEELNEDLATKRNASDGNRGELNNAKEELRISIREQAALKEKVAELEEEIEVLQADIEEEHNFAEQQKMRSLETIDGQLEKVKKEQQALQDQLANANIELHNAKRATKAAESERAELETKLRKTEKSTDDTFSIDQEKRELRRAKQKVEKDLERARTERDNLQQINQNLEDEINAEIERGNAEEHRLNTEIDLLRNKQITTTDARDRELTSAKSKIARLEARITDLDNQTKIISSPVMDVSGLKHDLEEARQKETVAAKREADLKSSNRQLKVQLHDLERDLHEARLAEYKAKSPSASPPAASSDEFGKLRRELLDAKAEIKHIQTHNRNIRRANPKGSVDETERADLHALLKASTVEAEALALKLSDRDSYISDLRSQVKRLRSERKNPQDKDISLRLSMRDNEAREVKHQLQRLRDERSIANKKAEAVEHELEILQSRYEGMLERLAEAKSRKDGVDEMREREMKGLMREVMWLKARCRREEGLRKAAAWGKGWVEERERMRVECNQVDLRILREMGVEVDGRRYERELTPRQRFRAGAFVVVAALRMKRLEEQWRGVRVTGEELRGARAKVARGVRRREV